MRRVFAAILAAFSLPGCGPLLGIEVYDAPLDGADDGSDAASNADTFDGLGKSPIGDELLETGSDATDATTVADSGRTATPVGVDALDGLNALGVDGPDGSDALGVDGRDGSDANDAADAPEGTVFLDAASYDTGLTDAGAIDADSAASVQCTPDASQCSPNNTPQTCDSKGQWSNASAGACSGTRPLCAGGSCVECNPSPAATQCSGKTAMQTCQANGTWGASTACPTICSGGTCLKATAVAGGWGFTCVLLSDGSIRCFGNNSQGQLGIGTSTAPDSCMAMTCSTKPLPVQGLTSSTAIAVGTGSACALLSDGSVKCWGAGSPANGARSGPNTCLLGDCTTTPIAVPGLTGAAAIVMGAAPCALLADRTVKCWGNNVYGQLGNGTTVATATPVRVSGLTNVTALTAGRAHLCALLSDGTVQCWGDNEAGQLGTGANSGPSTCGPSLTACSTTPVPVQGLSGVTAISAAVGGDHTCALLAGGAVACWGASGSGEAGNIVGVSPTPMRVPLVSVKSVAAGALTSCALFSSGTVQCWGDNLEGQLGIGNSSGPYNCGNDPCSPSPVSVSGLTDAVALGAGASCVIASDGSVHCWGGNNTGELGNGSSTGPNYCNANACSTTPIPVVW